MNQFETMSNIMTPKVVEHFESDLSLSEDEKDNFELPGAGQDWLVMWLWKNVGQENLPDGLKKGLEQKPITVNEVLEWAEKIGKAEDFKKEFSEVSEKLAKQQGI